MSKKILFGVVTAILVMAVTVGVTLAYFTADTRGTNVVTIGHVNISATLEDSSAPKSEVKVGERFDVQRVIIKNEGNNDAYIRVRLRPENISEIDFYTEIGIADESNPSYLKKITDYTTNEDWYHYKILLPKNGGEVRLTGFATLKSGVEADTLLTKGVQLQYYVEAVQTEHIPTMSDGFPQWPTGTEIKEYSSR